MSNQITVNDLRSVIDFLSNVEGNAFLRKQAVKLLAMSIREYNRVDDQTLTLAEHQLMKMGHKIEAIKSVRSRTKLGLKESKDLVEKFYPITRY